MVVKKHLDLAALAGGLLDDGRKLGKLVVVVVVAVAREAVEVMGGAFGACGQSRQRVMVLKAFFFLRVVFFCVPGGGVSAVQPDVRDFPGKGKAAFLGFGTVFGRRFFGLQALASRRAPFRSEGSSVPAYHKRQGLRRAQKAPQKRTGGSIRRDGIPPPQEGP